MENEEVKKLVQLRKFAMDFYNNLEEPNSSTSIMQTRDSAQFCISLIRSIEEVIKPYVEFEK
tara:strand:+ start:760 stop:945 length:186 start_codon:yes stop_codon:yes gene_type:complete